MKIGIPKEVKVLEGRVVLMIPECCPRTASQALLAVILPYVQCLCEDNLQLHKDLKNGINVRNREIDNPLIEQALKQ